MARGGVRGSGAKQQALAINPHLTCRRENGWHYVVRDQAGEPLGAHPTAVLAWESAAENLGRPYGHEIRRSLRQFHPALPTRQEP
jgi:hypothetical protein